MQLRYLVIGAAFFAGTIPASAQQTDALRQAPDYFVNGMMDTTTAQQLARACPDVSINPVAAKRYSDSILERLQADGFDTSDPDLGMVAPNSQLLEQQKAFVAKHNLGEGATNADACIAAKAEIAEGTQIGQLMLELP